MANKNGLTMTAAVLLACLAGGCGSYSISGADSTLPEGEGSPGFLDRASSMEKVSENDAFRGILMLVGDSDGDRTFEQRVTELRGKEIVADYWAFDASRPITRGKLAYMVYQACDFPGGVVLTLAGPSQRYCLRELQFRGIITDGAFYTPISGMEYVAVLNRADTYVQTGEVPDIQKTALNR